MTHFDVIRMAREAGIEVHPRKDEARFGLDALMGNDSTPKLERFAALVAAKERTRLGPELMMGDCMAMVHQDLKDMGLIGSDVPPMMIPEALARREALATAQVIDAIASEREACARICDGHHDQATTSPGAARANACAVAIRARGAA